MSVCLHGFPSGSPVSSPPPKNKLVEGLECQEDRRRKIKTMSVQMTILAKYQKSSIAILEHLNMPYHMTSHVH